MKHILNKPKRLFLALVAGMMVSCVGLKAPETARDVNVLDVGSTPGTTTVDLTARTDNAQAVSSCGFLWGTEKPENRVEADLHPDGSFNSRVSGLEPGTSFVFCAFICNGIDEKRSETLSFKTVARNDVDPGQPAIIPDLNFKSILLQRFDADGDGELSDFEINNVEDIDVMDDEIVSVEGIEYFNRLLRLNIRGEDNTFGYYPSGKLESIDISGNQSLVELGITHENISIVDISRNPGLIYLQLFSCPISSVNLTGGDNLVLFGAGYCKLSELTIKDLKMLDEVHIDHNVLTELSLENLPELRYLDCSGNQLIALDLSGCPKIEDIDCSENPELKTIFLKKGQKLKSFRRDEGVKISYVD